MYKTAVNKKSTYLFTSESVGPGHPDKLCDQISDSIVDLYLNADPYARVAAESLVTTNHVVIAGEVRGPGAINKTIIEDTVRNVIKNVGYEDDSFRWDKAKVDILLHEQSADIALGVDAKANKDEGAGDQGIMFGFACKETPVFMPASIYYSHQILQNILRGVEAGEIPKLGPDCKSQVTLEYDKAIPQRATSIVVSIQHKEGLSAKEIKEIIRPYVVATLPEGWMCEDDEFYVNPTGKFTIGGPHSDCGLTGRKIIVDTYGGAAPHGGGAFSGKDPTKVDRSAAYVARYLAKNVVAAGIAEICLIQLSYAIGVSKPLSFYINTHGTSEIAEKDIAKVLRDLVNLSPRGIREHLKLNQPIYLPTATYGHFGRVVKENTFPWEELDLVDELKSRFK